MSATKCQIIFFPVKHIPDEMEDRRLQHIQDMITGSHQEFRRKEKGGYHLTAIVMQQQFYNRIRSSLSVIDGGLEGE